MLAGVVDADRVAALRSGCRSCRLSCLDLARERRAGRSLVVSQRGARMRCGAGDHVRRRAGDDHMTAGIAAFGTEIDDPIGGANHVQVMLDHHQRVSSRDELAERAEQSRDVIEMQSRRGFIEQEELAALAVGARARPRRTARRA